MKYPLTYAETLDLADGARLALRTVRPSDRALLEETFARLSPESRRQRFLATKNSLSESELRRLTECDGDTDFVIVATTTDCAAVGPEIVAVARFARLGQKAPAAEIAIAVVDGWQRRGIGRALLERIVEAAAERGITQVDGVAFADNRQIRRLIGTLAPDVVTRYEDGLLRFTLPVPSEATPGTFSAYVEMLRLAARGAVWFPFFLGWAPVFQMASFLHRAASEPFWRESAG